MACCWAVYGVITPSERRHRPALARGKFTDADLNALAAAAASLARPPGAHAGLSAPRQR
jgi:hypothetical protein